MKALDTNILLRYLIRDDQKQATLAKAFIQQCTAEDRALINFVTLNEMVWALRKVYGYGKSLIADTIEKILETEQLRVENADVAVAALLLYRRYNVDFADALIGVINTQAGYPKTATFDKKAAQLTEFELLE